MAKTIAQIKKEYPEYKNVPDIKLAESLYNKYYKGKLDEDNYYAQVFPEYVEEIEANASMVSPDDLMMPKAGADLTSYKPTTAQVAERAGVSIDDPAAAKARFAGSLGYDLEQKRLGIKKVLSDLYKQDIDVRIGSNTGQLEYYNPEKKQYALVDAPGIELGDFTDYGGDAMVIIPDIVATIAVGTTTFGAGAIPAGAAAAFAGEYSRLKLGQKLYGINKNLSEDDLIKQASITAGISLVGGYGAVGLTKIVKSVNNAIKGRFINDDFVKMVNEPSKAEDIAKQINDKLDSAKINSKLKFKTSQALNDVDLLAAQQAFETTNRLGYVKEFRAAGIKEMEALNDYFALLRSEFDPKGLQQVQNGYDVGSLIQGVIQKRNEPALKQLINQQTQSELLLTKTLSTLPDGSKKLTGVTVRDAITDARRIFEENSKVALQQLEKASGGVTTGSNLIGKAIRDLRKSELDTLFKGLSPEIASYVKNPEVVKGQAVIPIQTLRNTLSKLNRKIRAGEKGLTTEDIDVGALKKLVGTINQQIRRDAPEPFIHAYDTFNDVYAKGKQRLDNSIIADVMQVKNKKLVVADEDIFDLTFKRGKGSKQVAEELHDVIKDYPQAMEAYKNSIYDFYRKRVAPEGLVNVKKHNQFISDYDDKLKVFFKPEDYSKIKKVGELKKYIDNLEQSRKDLITKLDKSFEGRLENLSAGEIVDKIYKPNNIGEIKKLKNILKNDPEIYRAFQQQVLKDLNERVVSKSGTLDMNIISPNKFKNYIFGTGGEKGYQSALREVFGDKFIGDLKVLNDALQITARKAPATLAREGVYGNFFTDIIRARIGQFTTPGRFLTAGKRLYTAASNRILKNAILNPEDLSDLIRLKKLKPGTKEAAYILGKLNALIFFRD